MLLDALLASHRGALVVDLAAVSFGDASLCHVVGDIERRARGRRRAFVLVGVRPPVDRLLAITGLEHLIHEVDEVDTIADPRWQAPPVRCDQVLHRSN
ncbi:MAG: STAS domain-containing protein [Acidimicrobiales bacterium]|nr:STAS domain-containing protein [Acidimicrobiales bacterium]HRW38295.1 STAS domain-containing protein [Aquihabitans sp.]